MIVNWTDASGRDKDGRDTELPAGSLRFFSPIPQGSTVFALRPAGRSGAILDSARRGDRGRPRSRGDRQGSAGAAARQRATCAQGLPAAPAPNRDEAANAVSPAVKDWVAGAARGNAPARAEEEGPARAGLAARGPAGPEAADAADSRVPRVRLHRPAEPGNKPARTVFQEQVILTALLCRRIGIGRQPPHRPSVRPGRDLLRRTLM